MLTRHSHPSQRRAAARGFTLVELMVSLALGLIIVSGMLTLLARNSETRGEIEKAGRQIENGRYAMQRLSEDIHHAGFYGEFYGLPAPTSVPDATATGACAVADGTRARLVLLQTNMALPIQAFTGVATGSQPSCILDADFVSGSNVLVLRFASPAAKLVENWATAALTNATTGLDIGGVYIHPNVEGVTFVRRTDATNFITSDTTDTTGTGFNNYLKISGAGGALVNAPIYRYITRIYFLSPCSRFASGQTSCNANADDGAPIRTLKVREFATDGTLAAPVPVAEGIERLEFDYGIDSAVGAAPLDGSADTYSRCAPCTAAEWARVVSVRISLLARNTEATAGYTDTKTYAMGIIGDVSPLTGFTNYKRHAFQAVVRVNNQSMRGEK